MSMPPNAIQQLLMQKLQQNNGPQPVGGGNAGPQMQGQTSPLNAAAQLAQKVMLMRSLQNPPTSIAQRQATNAVPATNAMIDPAMAQNSQVQAMQQGMQAPLPPLQPPQLPDPSLMPTPGYS